MAIPASVSAGETLRAMATSVIQGFELTPADRVLQKTPFSFDVSVWEFFLPLLSGARLVVTGEGALDERIEAWRPTAAERGVEFALVSPVRNDLPPGADTRQPADVLRIAKRPS